ncbi:MAG TPA: methyltransferase domain-containing protein [Bryobacteraceae bacterium]|nr:methyltransferase domain-containing protein [Bryobacteraceae bacterium]
MPTRTSQEQFDKQAAHYNAQWDAWNAESLEWLLKHAECAPSQRLLDVATGAGFTAVAFAALVAEAVGVDVSEGMLRQARERARGLSNVVFEQSPAESLPFPDSSFDRVVCRLAAHHFNSVPRFVSEAYRVLRPGGRLLIADSSIPDNAPEIDSWQNRLERLRDGSHVRNYSPSEWREFATGAGFTLERIEHIRELNPITLNAWLEKAGCVGEAAAQVRRMFAEAPAAAVHTFSLAPLPGGDFAFQWVRVVLSAAR